MRNVRSTGASFAATCVGLKKKTRLFRNALAAKYAAIPRPALRALGVDDASEHEIHNVLDAYNRANPENMLSVLCLLRLLGGATTSSTFESRVWTPPSTPQPLVAMSDVRTMPREVSDVLDLVAAPTEPGEPRVVQSLYRHFGHRPGFLALVVTLLRQRFDDGSIDRSVLAIRDAMSAEADKLAARLMAPPAPHRDIEIACRKFGGVVIPQMIVVGRLLDEALPA